LDASVLLAVEGRWTERHRGYGLSMDRRLADGAYDELVSAGLDALLGQPGLASETDRVDRAEATEVLAAHLEKVATRVLDSLPSERRLAVANAVLASLSDEAGDLVADGPRLLRSVGPATSRPQNPAPAS